MNILVNQMDGVLNSLHMGLLFEDYVDLAVLIPCHCLIHEALAYFPAPSLCGDLLARLFKW